MIKAFKTVKDALTFLTVLGLPNFDQAFVFQTDASAVVLGPVLRQEKEHGLVHLFQFACSKMNTIERI